MLACQNSSSNMVDYIVVNVYAPCPNNQSKIEFFENILDKANEFSLNYACNNIIVGGDFNLNFTAGEMKNRNYNAQEKRIATIVSDLTKVLNLKDIWADNSEFTWRRPNSDIFSTIHRILYSEDKFDIVNKATNWSLSMSDHAAIEVSLSLKNVEAAPRSKITRLNPFLISNEECRNMLISKVEELLNDCNNDWNPHMKLEYTKMCIRTVAERLQAERKRRDKSEEEEVSCELNIAIDALKKCTIAEDRDEIITHIEELRARKHNVVDKRGEELSLRLKSKWYNDGEKSTRYFL